MFYSLHPNNHNHNK